MSQSKTIVTCVFCGRQKPRSREDVFSHWMADLLEPDEDGDQNSRRWQLEFGTGDVGSGVTPTMTRPRSVASPHHMKADEVCGDCNNVWMSQGESANDDLLRRMIDGSATVLPANRQMRLALWCQVKLIALDAWQAQQDGYGRLLPNSLTTRLTKMYQPLPQLVVGLGRFEIAGSGFLPFGRRSFHVADPESDGEVLEFVRLTVVFKQLVVQGYVLLGREDAPVYWPEEADKFVRLWPPEPGWYGHAVVWPPPVSIEPGTFPELA